MASLGPVVLFCGSLAGDGVARNTIHLANVLARRGAAVTVTCLEGGALAQDLRGPALACIGRRRGPRGFALARAVPALTAHLKRLGPSVVVSMGNHAHLAVWAAMRGLPDTPRIYRISNEPDHGGDDRMRATLRGFGLRLVASDATGVVCVSAAIAGREPFRRARRDRRVDVLPNGVDGAAIRARAEERVRHPWLDDARPYLVAVGRLHAQKNYETLIDALAIVRRRQPGARLLIIGGGAADRRAKLKARAQVLGLEGAVRFEGEVANPYPLLARASAYVLPSLWEGASNSLLEALACGVPVVASRTAGNADEVLDGGRYGVLADPNDPADLAQGLLRQLSPDDRILPEDRAEAFRLDAVVDRLCAIVAAARSAHDEIQMQAAGTGHLHPLSDRLRGTNTEY